MELNHKFTRAAKLKKSIQQKNILARDDRYSVVESLNNTLTKEVAIRSFYEDEKNNPKKDEIDKKRSFRENILSLYEEITWMLRP